MAKDFLLEIGLEEIPAQIVTPSMNQLKAKVSAFLESNALAFESIEAFSTPRRLAVRVNQLAEKQADVEEEVKGPAKKIALDAEGNWSKAAQGFVRGQGLTTEDITFKELNGTEYVFVNKFVAGKMAEEVLVGIKDIITSLTFPVSMHWADHDFKYIRPIHWLVALLDETIVPFEILTIPTGRTSRGHRFLGKDLSFDHANQYEEKLLEEFVIANPLKRQGLIVEQAEKLAQAKNWQVGLDEDLLEEVTNLVEYPTAFVGTFDEKYLAVPEEVLITSMKEHQRYFDVKDSQGQLLPYFVAVRNGNSEYLENVVRGNEKVLTARLEDAEFFYQEDHKLTIAECVEKLKKVTFHEKIGTTFEKMQRVHAIAQLIGREVGLTDEQLADLARASDIYKFDLVTNMVGEFPELQGIMGEKYALTQGEKPAVAQAIREHYLPTSSEGVLPESAVGSVLALADKVDSLFSFFAVGLVPTGSNDPYALRRQTYGAIRIVENQGWKFPIIRLQNEIAAVINQDSERYGITLDGQQKEVAEFMKARMKQWLSSRGVRHDVIEAVTSAEQDDISTIFEAAAVLKAGLDDQDFKPSVEALTRVINLAQKGQQAYGHLTELIVDPTLFENQEEKNLYEAVKTVAAEFSDKTLNDNYQALKALRPTIESYFNETMVMSEDEAIRRNRLTQLMIIARMALSFASLEQLVIK